MDDGAAAPANRARVFLFYSNHVIQAQITANSHPPRKLQVITNPNSLAVMVVHGSFECDSVLEYL